MLHIAYIPPGIFAEKASIKAFYDISESITHGACIPALYVLNFVRRTWEVSFFINLEWFKIEKSKIIHAIITIV